jgi:hypothetical protein
VFGDCQKRKNLGKPKSVTQSCRAGETPAPVGELSDPPHKRYVETQPRELLEQITRENQY